MSRDMALESAHRFFVPAGWAAMFDYFQGPSSDNDKIGADIPVDSSR